MRQIVFVGLVLLAACQVHAAQQQHSVSTPPPPPGNLPGGPHGDSLHVGNHKPGMASHLSHGVEKHAGHEHGPSGDVHNEKKESKHHGAPVDHSLNKIKEFGHAVNGHSAHNTTSSSAMSSSSPSFDHAHELGKSPVSSSAHAGSVNVKHGGHQPVKHSPKLVTGKSHVGPTPGPSHDHVSAVAHDDDSDSAQAVNVQQVTLDTMTIDAGGNWLAKRYWYQKAEELYGALRGMSKEVSDMPVKFYQAAQDIVQQFDTFYDTVSYEKGHLDELLSIVKKQLENEQALRGDLSVQERTEMQSLKAEQQKVQNLAGQIKYIHELDKKVDETVSQAMRQVADTLKYEEKAWESFKAIGKELSDQKAEAEFYKMQSYQKNIEQMHSYLSGALMNYLQQQLIGSAKTAMQQSRETIQELEKSGIDIAHAVKLYVKKDPELVAQREEQQRKAEEKIAQQKHQEQQEQERKKVVRYKQKAQPDPAWYEKAWCWIVSFVKNIYCSVYKFTWAFYCTMKSMLS